MAWIIGDIGGTNTRLVLLFSPEEEFLEFKVYESQKYKHFEDILENYLKELLEKYSDLSELSLFLSVAGPIVQEKAFLTNLNWTISAQQLKKSFPFEKVILKNDLVCLSGCIFLLSKEELLEIKKGEEIQEYPKVFLSVGTGLGISLFISQDPLVILPTEGGHSLFPCKNKEELEILDYLERNLGEHDYESFLSGKSLPYLYQYFYSENKIGEEIFELARKGEEKAQKVIEKFFVFLGRKCYNLAVTFLPYGGIYLAGGVLQKNKDFFFQKKFKNILEEEFYSSQRLTFLLERIPIFLILHPFPGLLGVKGLLLHSQL